MFQPLEIRLGHGYEWNEVSTNLLGLQCNVFLP